jgi:hypothetical protein
MQQSGTKDMFQYTPEHGTQNWGEGAADAAAGAGIGARAFVPPANNNSNVAPYTEDYAPSSPRPANDDGYYYSPTTATSAAGAGYSQQGDDFYDRYQPSPNNGYHGYQDDTTDYSEHGYYNSGDGFSDAGAAAAGMAKMVDVGDKTYMHNGENDPRQIFSKPDARE